MLPSKIPKILLFFLVSIALRTLATPASSRSSAETSRLVRGANKPEVSRRVQGIPNERVRKEVINQLRELTDSPDDLELDDPELLNGLKLLKELKVDSADLEMDDEQPPRDSRKGKGFLNELKVDSVDLEMDDEQPPRDSRKGKGSKKGKKNIRSKEGAAPPRGSTSKSRKSKVNSKKGAIMKGDNNEGGSGITGSGTGGGSGGGGGGSGDSGDDLPPVNPPPVNPPTLDPRLEEFDLTDCDSFSNEWLFDLAATCDMVDGDLINCQCFKAGWLFDQGALTCATIDQRFMNPPACPLRCPVCEPWHFPQFVP